MKSEKTIFQEFQKDYKISNKYFKHDKRVSNSDAIDHQPVSSNKNVDKSVWIWPSIFSWAFVQLKIKFLNVQCATVVEITKQAQTPTLFQE